MEQALIPVAVGKTDSGEIIFFTPGKTFTQAFYNQERAAQKNMHQ